MLRRGWATRCHRRDPLPGEAQLADSKGAVAWSYSIEVAVVADMVASLVASNSQTRLKTSSHGRKHIQQAAHLRTAMDCLQCARPIVKLLGSNADRLRWLETPDDSLNLNEL